MPSSTWTSDNVYAPEASINMHFNEFNLPYIWRWWCYNQNRWYEVPHEWLQNIKLKWPLPSAKYNESWCPVLFNCIANTNANEFHPKIQSFKLYLFCLCNLTFTWPLWRTMIKLLKQFWLKRYLRNKELLQRVQFPLITANFGILAKNSNYKIVVIAANICFDTKTILTALKLLKSLQQFVKASPETVQ